MATAEKKIPQVVLLRVGMDSGVGGIQGPLLDAKGTFDFLPIPDDWSDNNPVTYGTTLGRHGRFLVEYWAGKAKDRYQAKGIHFDPEFETCTYGDPTTPKQSLRWLEPGDILVFYAGLQPWTANKGFHGDPHLYIIGYFIVAKAGHMKDLCKQLGRDAIEKEFARCIHIVKGAPIQQKLVLVRGAKGSRLFDRATLLSEYGRDRKGNRIKVLHRDMKKHFGSFSKLNSLQRSPPRWVSEEFCERAYAYVTGLK